MKLAVEKTLMLASGAQDVSWQIYGDDPMLEVSSLLSSEISGYRYQCQREKLGQVQGDQDDLHGQEKLPNYLLYKIWIG